MTATPPTEAVIFDCDGTLVDSVSLGFEVLSECLATVGVALSLDDVARGFGSGELALAISRLEQSLGRCLPADFVPDFRRRRDAAVRTRLRVMPGAEALLSGLRLPLAVASNGPLDQTRLSLEVTGLLRHFDPHVFSAYDVGKWKPDPELFLHSARVLGVSPARCVVVEDAALGVEAALAAGMTVFVLGDHDPWQLPNVHVIENLTQVGHRLAAKDTA